MPSGRTHDKIGFTAAIPLSLAYGIGGAALGYSGVVRGALLGVSIVAATYWFSPDLDITSIVHKRWGPWQAIWLPYKWLVPHRHKISHSTFLGPVIRILYLFGFIFIGLLILSPDLLKKLLYSLIQFPEVIFGIFIANWLHIKADFLVTNFRRRKWRYSRRSSAPRARRRH